MITDIPDREDFWNEGMSMLNLAWGSVSSLYEDAEFSELAEWDDSGEYTDEYWRAAGHSTSVALALAVQGIELLLKARIAEVSPLLLVAGSPREWPAGCHEHDTTFSDFRTIDAQELVRAHDALITPRLDPAFKTEFHRLRRLRNVVFHSVNRRERPAALDVWRVILEAVENLDAPRSWFRNRRRYLETGPKGIAWPAERTDLTLVWEYGQMMRLLRPAELQRYFGFQRRQRRYLCRACTSSISDFASEARIAFLQPNSPESNTLFCPVCDETSQVLRSKCSRLGCRGNVISLEDEYQGAPICLTCGKEQ